MNFELFSAWPAEARAFAIAVERAGRLIRAARRGIAAADGMSLANWRLLTLAHRTSARSQAALARRLRISRQAVHSMARDLESARFVAIARDPGRRKAARIVLTTGGWLKIAVLDETLWTVLHEVMNDIPREALVSTADLLNRFSARLRRCETVLRHQRPVPARKRRA